MRHSRSLLLLLLLACAKSEPPAAPPRPSILLVTLDTTRADAIGPGTPSFNALAAKGRRFTQAYAAAPQTLPSHASMMTGLYPGGHGVHENARYLVPRQPLLAERLKAAGYRTAAFVSAFPLTRRFGLARGFDVYDDSFENERSARETTDRAITFLTGAATAPVGDAPMFLWLHYFEPHAPYAPPDGFRDRKSPYLGEVAAMDAQLGRLVSAFRQRYPDAAIIVAGDHGEGLGEHGEAEHGNLVYNSTMHVPLLLAGPGVTAGTHDAPVSIRRIFHTVLDWAGLGAEHSLRAPSNEVVLGESMIPFLQYGWQPQIMAVDGRTKVIHTGKLETYDVIADPAESREIAADLSRPVREALRDYPIPANTPAPITDEDRKRLASLGYISSPVKPAIRKDAPRPRDMVDLFDELDRASTLFTAAQYAAAIPVLEQILAADPHNLVTLLRLAAAHSNLGHDDAAMAAFRRAEAIAPDSPDVRTYLAMHYAKSRDWERAVPLLERVVAETPDRLPALEALATLRERQNRPADALQLYQRIATLRPLIAPELVRCGQLAMAVGQTASAIDFFERARAFGASRDLELGVLYLAARRFEDARAALDRAPASPMQLFKRAQVSVLLNEPDRAARIAAARARADETTRELIANERLFR